MAKNLLVALFILASLASSSCSKGLRVLLYNNAQVDLTVRIDDKTIAAYLGPGESAEIYWHESQLVEFGAIAHLYEYKGTLRIQGFFDPEKDIVKVQAENDGRLYLVPPHELLPARVPREQPVGFPLSPTEKSDLT